jgi:pyruvate kinase
MSLRNNFRHTKIICTIGPASSSHESIRELILAGMDAARLNFSHGTLSEHAEKILAIRKISEELGKPIAILQDLAGPKIRVGHIPDPGVRLEAGETIILTTEILEGSNERVSVSDRYLPEEVKPGDMILLADGLMELKVKKLKGREIDCEVITGGVLTSNKGINLPTGTIRMPSMTDKDREDLLFGIENGVDYIALSFVRTAQDILGVKEIIKRRGKDTPVIAKIEKHEAISHIEDIMEVSDGIMVARGDLGVEIPLERVPVIQKQLVQSANRNGKPVIIATQMLRSMVNSPRPTRAEATDVANAVLDGTDAVMLSEETAVGEYPVKAVQFMARIAMNAEGIYPHDKYLQIVPEKKISESVAYASCVLADQLDASAIIAPTRSGRTAAHLSRFRPRCGIIALSPNLNTVQRLSLFRGCVPRLLPESGENDIIEKASFAALETGLAAKGDLVVITGGQPGEAINTTNMIRVVRL